MPPQAATGQLLQSSTLSTGSLLQAPDAPIRLRRHSNGLPLFLSMHEDRQVAPSVVVARKSFDASSAAFCITISQGQKMLLHNTDPSGWSDVECQGKRGWVPSSCISAKRGWPQYDANTYHGTSDDGTTLSVSSGSDDSALSGSPSPSSHSSLTSAPATTDVQAPSEYLVQLMAKKHASPRSAETHSSLTARPGLVPMDASQTTMCVTVLYDLMRGELAAFMGCLSTFEDVAFSSAFQRLVDIAHELLAHAHNLSSVVHSIAALSPAPWVRPLAMTRVLQAKTSLDKAIAQFGQAQNISGQSSLSSDNTPSQHRAQLMGLASALMDAGNESLVAVNAVLEMAPPGLSLQIWRPTSMPWPPPVARSSVPLALRERRIQQPKLSNSPPFSKVSSPRLPTLRIDIPTVAVPPAPPSAPLPPRPVDVARQASVEDDVEELAQALSSFIWGGASMASSPRSSMDSGLWDTSTMSASKLQEATLHHGMLVHQKEGRLLGGDLPGLVHALCHDLNDLEHTQRVKHFLLTFRWFATPRELALTLQSLAHTFHVNLHFTCVARFLALWLDGYWYAPLDTEALPILDEFLGNAPEEMDKAYLEVLMQLLVWRRQAGAEEQLHQDENMNRPAVDLDVLSNITTDPLMEFMSLYNPPSVEAELKPMVSCELFNALDEAKDMWDVDVAKFHPMELARQITLMESELYCAITPHELLNRPEKYKGSEYVSKSVNVKEMSLITTQLTNWFGECILREPELSRRSEKLNFFIQLGQASLTLQNYNLLMAVLGALNSSTILRLKKTWAGLSSHVHAQYAELVHVMEHPRNFATYRARLRSSVGPTLPFLGLMLTDMTFGKGGNPVERTFPEFDAPMYNFVRCQKLGRMVEDLQRFQQPYLFQRVPQIQAFLSRVRKNGGAETTSDYGLAAEQLYQRSLQLEPRETWPLPPKRTRSSSVMTRTLQAWRSSSFSTMDSGPSSPTTSTRSSETRSVRDLFQRRFDIK
ncbi:Ras guanine nucleotide exchange factor Bud5 [Malassezia pachydermatis]|uniref:Ras gef n=1 Tax=Malassezia pachydermatis TaxID=77020 RepID=A0A0M9VN41_9BASI|nr:ras gef [Malassezia pachydermatis]KOS12923.1 ras gef [Malassezia pachydermatis]